MESFSIGTIDIIIVVVYLLFIIWWGVKNGKSSDAQSYFLAGRSMPWWVVGLSLFAASISSTTLIGQSGDAYDTGLAVFNYNLTGIVVMVFFAVFLLPLYIRSKVFTIPEFPSSGRESYPSSSHWSDNAWSHIPHRYLPGRPAHADSWLPALLPGTCRKTKRYMSV